MPRARAAGLVAAASKRPDAYFGQPTVQNVQSVAPADVALQSFDKLEDAREWLRKVSPSDQNRLGESQRFTTPLPATCINFSQRVITSGSTTPRIVVIDPSAEISCVLGISPLHEGSMRARELIQFGWHAPALDAPETRTI